MRAFLAVSALVVASGCIADQVAFEALFTEEDRAQEPGIVGTWSSGDADDPFVATIRATDGEYELVTTEDGKPQRPLGVRLGWIGGQLYWDAVPLPLEGKGGPAEGQLLPLHSIARVSICGDRLLVSPLRSKWIEAARAEGRLDTPYVLVQGDPVLSGTSAELQRFVAEHGDEEGAFAESAKGTGCGSESGGVMVLQRVASAS